MQSTKLGTLHLIPNILSEDGHHHIPSYLIEIVTPIKHYYVEEIRSARRLLKKLNREIDIDSIEFYFLNEHQEDSKYKIVELLKKGIDVGFISEAGCPNIADPGQALVELVHSISARVIPHTGPNSILLALMASGFNGQQFQFHGYLPNKQPALSQKIKEIELESKTKNCTQLFIETPYRNNQLLAELIKTCRPETRLCIASDITGKNELIKSQSIQKWKQETISFHKMPSVFVLYVG